MTKRISVYPGTFDPITSGHMDIINRAIPLTDKLIIAVSQNFEKKPIFKLEERVELIRNDIKHIDADIEVTSFQGLLVDFCKRSGAKVIIRGLRAVSDFEYEFKMASMNERLAPEIETVFLMASDKCQFVSSRLVKEVAFLGGDVSQFVSQYVLDRLQQVISIQNELSTGK